MTFRSIGYLGAELVCQVERVRKLKLISGLTRSEIEGWRDQLRLGSHIPYDGELAVLSARELELERAT